MILRQWACACLASAAIMLSPLTAPAQQSSQPGRAPRPAPGGDPHAQHGTPKGWRFTWPKGDIAKGRAAFAKFECYACHEVKGETFPAPREPDKVGPELSVMGPLHEVDYFAESVLNPGAVIERGKGYQAADGSSKMPSFNDSMTAQELIDLVAYLRALKPPQGGQGHRGH
jgi:mono/diheme cytochrome c family protein